jgi:hypothetical protein
VTATAPRGIPHPETGELLLPIRGEERTAGRQDEDLVCYSVTTVLKAMDKSDALTNWAVNETAARVVARLRLLQRRFDEEGEASAVDYVKGLRWDTGGNLSDSALGTLAHKLFDDYALTGARPKVTPDLHPDHASKHKVLSDEDQFVLRRMLDQFDRFLQQFQPEYHCCEVVVYHPDYGYAGQLDAMFSIDRIPLIGDYKSSRKSWTAAGKEKQPYSENALQLAAYRHASHAAVWRARRYENNRRRYYLLSETERAAAVPVPPVEGGVVILVTPDRYAVHPARCGDREWEAFLYCLEMARWMFNEATSVIGDEMVPPHELPEPDGDPFEGLPREGE